MNQNNIFSLPAAATDLVPFRRVKMTSTGVNYAGATDAAIGTLLPGDPGDETQAAIQGSECGLHFATVGSATAIAVGDEIEGAASGKVVKKASGTAIGVATEASTASDDVIRVRYY